MLATPADDLDALEGSLADADVEALRRSERRRELANKGLRPDNDHIVTTPVATLAAPIELGLDAEP